MIAIVILYLILCTALNIVGIFLTTTGSIGPLIPYNVSILCAFSGGIAGCLYCLRGVYLNKCVHDRWNDKWLVWYLLRPITSIICGGVSYLFLRAGLIIMEANVQAESSEFGFYAFAFIAGYNVDNFLNKLE